jgi:Skp family chaperone for outer membrane proteins
MSIDNIVPADSASLSRSLVTVQAAVDSMEKLSARIVVLQTAHPANLVADPSTKDGMATLVAGHKAWRTPRLELEQERKKAKGPVNALAKDIDALAARLEKGFREGEDNYFQQIEAYKAEQARLAEEAKKKDDERKEKHQKAIAVIRSYSTMASGLPSARIASGIVKLESMRFGAEWEEFASHAVIAQTETLVLLRQMLTQTQQAEAEVEAQRIKQEAEDAAREQQRLENERVAAALKAQQDAIEAQKRELQRQQDELNAQRAAMAPPAAAPAVQAPAAPASAPETDAPATAVAPATAQPAPVLPPEPASVTAARAVLVMRLNPSQAAKEEPTMKLGDLNASLGSGITMTETFVCETLQIPKPTPPAGARGVLFYPSQRNQILEALAEHALKMRGA